MARARIDVVRCFRGGALRGGMLTCGGFQRRLNTGHGDSDLHSDNWKFCDFHLGGFRISYLYFLSQGIVWFILPMDD